MTLTAADLTQENFGSIEFDFTASEGGAVFAEYSAFGRFSLETSGQCIGSGSSVTVAPNKEAPSHAARNPDLGSFAELQ